MKVDKSPVELRPSMLKSSTPMMSVVLEQLRNMLAIFVTAAVLKLLTSRAVRLVQLRNMSTIFVTAVVLKLLTSREVRLEHSRNM